MSKVVKAWGEIERHNRWFLRWGKYGWGYRFQKWAINHRLKRACKRSNRVFKEAWEDEQGPHGIG